MLLNILNDDDLGYPPMRLEGLKIRGGGQVVIFWIQSAPPDFDRVN